jgi:hypothetical protein
MRLRPLTTEHRRRRGWLGHRIARLRNVVEQGESPATPALVAALALAVVVPVVALAMSAAIVGNRLASNDARPQVAHASAVSSRTGGAQRPRRSGAADGRRARPER